MRIDANTTEKVHSYTPTEAKRALPKLQEKLTSQGEHLNDLLKQFDRLQGASALIGKGTKLDLNG